MAGVSGVGLLEIAERAGLDSGLVIRLVEEIADAIAKGERVKLRGFGSFEARDPNSDSTRAPLVRFMPSKALRAAVSLRETIWHATGNDPSSEEE